MQFKNKLLVDVTVEVLKEDGTVRRDATIHVEAGKKKSFDPKNVPKPGQKLRVLFTEGGSLVFHKKIKKGDSTYRVTANSLKAPNDLPEPTFNDPGSMYLVGQGLDSNHNIITRERWWELSPASVDLLPNESRSWTMTFYEGVEESQSSLKSMSSELSTSSSAGWGPVSASLTASLSASSSTQETISLSTQTTETETRNLLNTNQTQVMSARSYQMYERITIWDHSKHTKVKSQLVNRTDLLKTISQYQ